MFGQSVETIDETGCFLESNGKAVGKLAAKVETVDDEKR
jgi:hypothetical protein